MSKKRHACRYIFEDAPYPRRGGVAYASKALRCTATFAEHHCCNTLVSTVDKNSVALCGEKRSARFIRVRVRKREGRNTATTQPEAIRWCELKEPLPKRLFPCRSDAAAKTSFFVAQTPPVPIPIPKTWDRLSCPSPWGCFRDSSHYSKMGRRKMGVAGSEDTLTTKESLSRFFDIALITGD